jgi:hypothetical protein
MPRIEWSGLPPALRDHLFDRLRERKITAEDLYQPKTWRESNPDAPHGLRYKDFGSFKICGDGKYPKTFLLAGEASQRAKALTPSRAEWSSSCRSSSCESDPVRPGCDGSVNLSNGVTILVEDPR